MSRGLTSTLCRALRASTTLGATCRSAAVSCYCTCCATAKKRQDETFELTSASHLQLALHRGFTGPTQRACIELHSRSR